MEEFIFIQRVSSETSLSIFCFSQGSLTPNRKVKKIDDCVYGLVSTEKFKSDQSTIGHQFGSFFTVYPMIGNDFAIASEKQSFSAKYFLFIKVETSHGNSKEQSR